MKPSISIMDEVDAFGLSLDEAMSIKNHPDDPTILGEVYLLEPERSRVIMASNAFCAFTGIKNCNNLPYRDLFHEDDLRHYLFLYRQYLYQLKVNDPVYASFSKLVRVKVQPGTYKTLVLSQRGAIFPREGIYRYRGIFRDTCILEDEVTTELDLNTLNSLGELVQALMLKIHTVSSLCNNISEKNCLGVSCKDIRTIFDRILRKTGHSQEWCNNPMSNIIAFPAGCGDTILMLNGSSEYNTIWRDFFTCYGYDISVYSDYGGAVEDLNQNIDMVLINRFDPDSSKLICGMVAELNTDVAIFDLSMARRHKATVSPEPGMKILMAVREEILKREEQRW